VTLTTDLAYSSATEIASRVKRRELSPVEVIDVRRQADVDVLAASAAFDQIKP
jgi:hypothetical protein